MYKFKVTRKKCLRSPASVWPFAEVTLKTLEKWMKSSYFMTCLLLVCLLQEAAWSITLEPDWRDDDTTVKNMFCFVFYRL